MAGAGSRLFVASDGGSSAFFTDDFTSYATGTTDNSINGSGNGFSWGGGNTGFIQIVDCSSFQRSGGSNRAVEFNFNTGNNAELDFAIGNPGYTELYLRYYLYYPSGSESPSVGPAWTRTGSGNNKFIRIGDGATHADDLDMRFGASTDQTGSDEEIFLETGGPTFYVSPGAVPIGDHVDPFTASILGSWAKIEWHLKSPTTTPTGWGEGNGIIQVWVNDVLRVDYTVGSQSPANTKMRNGYLFGYPNGSYSAGSKVYMTDFAIGTSGRA